jgi:hypothetical protein
VENIKMNRAIINFDDIAAPAAQDLMLTPIK